MQLVHDRTDFVGGGGSKPISYVRVLACYPKVAGVRMTSTVEGICHVLALYFRKQQYIQFLFLLRNTMGVAIILRSRGDGESRPSGEPVRYVHAVGTIRQCPYWSDFVVVSNTAWYPRKLCTHTTVRVASSWKPMSVFEMRLLRAYDERLPKVCACVTSVPSPAHKTTQHAMNTYLCATPRY